MHSKAMKGRKTYNKCVVMQQAAQQCCTSWHQSSSKSASSPLLNCFATLIILLHLLVCILPLLHLYCLLKGSV
eukprot:2582926-Rhodomonas_salina.1